jgi:hypothetical protein
MLYLRALSPLPDRVRDLCQLEQDDSLAEPVAWNKATFCPGKDCFASTLAMLADGSCINEF